MRYFLILSASALAFSTPAMAQDASAAELESEDNIILPIRRIFDHEITVLATGLRQRIEQSGQSIAVLGDREIASIQGPDITRLVERLPGVTLTRNGGLGGFTSLFVRGANSQQVLILLDGVRAADAAAPSGGYDFGNLMTGPLGKVELLRGSNSVVWGSDAIGGVIAMTSREVHGLEGSAEYGARDTFSGDVSAGFDGNSSGTVSVGYTQTDGFSQAGSGSEADGFRQYRVSGHGRLALSGDLSLVAAGRYADSRLEFDGFAFSFPFGLEDTPEYSETREASGRVGLEYLRGDLDLTASYSLHDIARDNFDPRFGSDPGFASDGRQQRIEARGRIDSLSWRLDFGASHDWSSFDTNFDEPASARSTGSYALATWQGNMVNFSAGARLDDHSRFGSEVTLGANGSVRFADHWRLRASYGEGFKAPTLYQLFSDFGNETLAPERSRSYDIAIERGARGGTLHLAATAFRRDTRSLIDFVSCFSVSDPLCGDGRFGFYQNVRKARAEGFELELGARLDESFQASAAYSYIKATDRASGKALARRPRHAVTVALDWKTPLAGLALGADVRMVSASFDDGGNFTRLDGYALGTLRASLPVTERIEFYGRIENVTDTAYQTAAGYGTTGRSAFIGARARF